MFLNVLFSHLSNCLRDLTPAPLFFQQFSGPFASDTSIGLLQKPGPPAVGRGTLPSPGAKSSAAHLSFGLGEFGRSKKVWSPPTVDEFGHFLRILGSHLAQKIWLQQVVLVTALTQEIWL